MKDSLAVSAPEPIGSDVDGAEALHALGSFYVRQGFPKQGLSLLLTAHRMAVPSMALNRAIAHAYVEVGLPDKALAMLDALEPAFESERMRRAGTYLRARALLALGRSDEARDAFRAVAVRDGERLALMEPEA